MTQRATSVFSHQLLSTLLVLAGCGGQSVDMSVDDSGIHADAHVATDSGAHDAGAADAGELDAGQADAGAVETDAGTPDAGMPSPVMPMAAGDLVITEFMAAPLGYADDSLAEWVEIHNPSATVTYDLNGCVFSDKPADDDHVLTASLLIAPGGYIVVTSAQATLLTHGFDGDDVYGAVGTGLSATADAPTIKCASVVIDTVSYSAANGFALPSAMEGHTLQLDPASSSASANDLGANWCFGTTSFFGSDVTEDFGTPGAANTACP